jgi:hypothetical protein
MAAAAVVVMVMAPVVVWAGHSEVVWVLQGGGFGVRGD